MNVIFEEHAYLKALLAQMSSILKANEQTVDTEQHDWVAESNLFCTKGVSSEGSAVTFEFSFYFQICPSRDSICCFWRPLLLRDAENSFSALLIKLTPDCCIFSCKRICSWQRLEFAQTNAVIAARR